MTLLPWYGTHCLYLLMPHLFDLPSSDLHSILLECAASAAAMPPMRAVSVDSQGTGQHCYSMLVASVHHGSGIIATSFMQVF